MRWSPRRRGQVVPEAPGLAECGLLMLEPRVLMTAVVSLPSLESLDGTGNNPLHGTWGAVNADLLRTAPSAYGDGISTPAGADRPSARLISDTIAAHPAEDLVNNRNLSDMVYIWGQFIDHDMDLTGGGTPADAFNVAVPYGDPYFDPGYTGSQLIYLTRSVYDPATGTGT